MKLSATLKVFGLLVLNFTFVVRCLVQIELKKHVAKLHNQFLKSLKFMQVLTNKEIYSSFLEEKDVPLHQQVLAQKRLATYYGDINVGFGRDGDPNKSQKFKMLFDTGSCEFWIPSENCSTKRCLTHTRYTKSDTCKPFNHAKIAIQYLSGKVNGDMARETIGLGDLTVPGQVIGIADEVEIPLLDEVIWDGILGLAYPNKNLKKQHITPIFDTIIDQGLLTGKNEKNQFAYYLGSNKGSITFGGADMRFKRDLEEEFKWAPISERNYWTISLIDIRKYSSGEEFLFKEMENVTEDDGGVLCPSGCKTIIDTGTYLIYGPSDQLINFLSDMRLDNCNQKYSLPTLGLVFRGMKLNGHNTNFELRLTPDDYVLEFDVDGKSDCVIGIGSDTEDSGWTLGQVFLKAYYTVFDRDSEAVGFVRSNPEPFDRIKVSELKIQETKEITLKKDENINHLVSKTKNLKAKKFLKSKQITIESPKMSSSTLVSNGDGNGPISLEDLKIKDPFTLGNFNLDDTRAKQIASIFSD